MSLTLCCVVVVLMEGFVGENQDRGDQLQRKNRLPRFDHARTRDHGRLCQLDSHFSLLGAYLLYYMGFYFILPFLGLSTVCTTFSWGSIQDANVRSVKFAYKASFVRLHLPQECQGSICAFSPEV